MNLIAQHPAVIGIAAYWVFSALVGGMPALQPASSASYQWLYNSLHILSGNLTTAITAKYPQLPAGATQTTTAMEKTVTQVPKQ